MFKKKSLALLVSLMLILCATVGTTLALLIDKTLSVENIFTPSKVTTEVDEDIETDPDVKQNVRIRNTGDTTAWIRANVIVTWQLAEGEDAGAVYGKMPVAGEDYTISDLGSGWEKAADGFYYWKSPVAKGTTTGVMFAEIKPVANKAPDGYTLHVEIVGSGIQSTPTSVVTTEWSSGVSAASSTVLTVIKSN